MADQTGNRARRTRERATVGGVGSWIGGMFVDPKGTFESICARTHMPHPTRPGEDEGQDALARSP